MKTAEAVKEVLFEIEVMLTEKNKKYGDSALTPLRIFSKADPLEQLNVRIDDKLSRILVAEADDREDAELDLIGYLVLKRAAQRGEEVLSKNR